MYVHITDVEFGTKIQEGMAVRFQLYTDHRGVTALLLRILHRFLMSRQSQFFFQCHDAGRPDFGGFRGTVVKKGGTWRKPILRVEVGACDVQATSVEPQMVPLAATPPVPAQMASRLVPAKANEFHVFFDAHS